MIDSLISKTTWVTKIGHELTFVPTIHVSDSDKAFISDPDSCGWPYEYRMHLENVDYLFNAQIKRNRIDVADCGIDMHCIEISSKPLNSWK